MHVAVAGNIGSGKTTLTSLLSKHYKWEAQYEDVDDNPYLNDFYQDMSAGPLTFRSISSTAVSVRSLRSVNREKRSSRTAPFMRMLIFSLPTCTAWD
jgi:broad-specificity NMP kinase